MLSPVRLALGSLLAVVLIRQLTEKDLCSSLGVNSAKHTSISLKINTGILRSAQDDGPKNSCLQLYTPFMYANMSRLSRLLQPGAWYGHGSPLADGLPWRVPPP
jgi:hypothetical protein